MRQDRRFTIPPETFRVRPGPRSRCYFVVHLADNVPAMKRAMRTHVGFAHRRQLAACISGAAPHRHGFVGILFFSKTCIGGGIVGHEMAHAAFRYLERRRARVLHWLPKPDGSTHPTEERFCRVAEHLAADFWRRFYALPGAPEAPV